MQQCIRILLFLILSEDQHVLGDTPPISRSLKLHKQPLVLHNTVKGCRTCSCWTWSGSVRYLSTSKLPIIRSLKLHKQPLVLHNTVKGCRTCSCWTWSGSVRYLNTSKLPIIRSLKLHSSFWFCIILWQVVGRAVVGRGQVAYAT